VVEGVAAAADAAAVSGLVSTASISSTTRPGSAAGSTSASFAAEPAASAAAAHGNSRSFGINYGWATGINHSTPAAAQGPASFNSIKQLLAAFPCSPSWMTAGGGSSSDSSLAGGSSCIDYKVTAAASNGSDSAASESSDAGSSSDSCEVECHVRVSSTAAASAGAGPAGCGTVPALQSAWAASKEAAAVTAAAAEEEEAAAGFGMNIMLADVVGMASPAAAYELDDGYCFISDETEAVAAEMAAALKGAADATAAAAGYSLWLDGAAAVAASAGKVWSMYGAEIMCCMFVVGGALCGTRAASHHGSIIRSFIRD
jgi:hypothetical protein